MVFENLPTLGNRRKIGVGVLERGSVWRGVVRGGEGWVRW